MHLFDQEILKKKELYWYHDFDAYQQEIVNENELDLDNFDLGLTHYFYKPEWQFGSFFFRQSAKDILELLDHSIRARPHLSRNDEKTLTNLRPLREPGTKN